MSDVRPELVDERAPVPVTEVLDCVRIERTYLIELVEAGVATPAGSSVEQWTFVRGDLRRLRIAQRLSADLDVNAAGVALILDLLEERDTLLKRLRSNDPFDDF